MSEKAYEKRAQHKRNTLGSSLRLRAKLKLGELARAKSGA